MRNGDARAPPSPSRIHLLLEFLKLAQTSSRQPLLLGSEPVAQECKNGDTTEDDRGVVEAFSSDRPVDGREQDSGEVQVPNHSDEGQRTRPATERPACGLEVVWSDEDTAETYEGVSHDGGDTGRTDQGSEGDWRRQNGANQEGGDSEHDSDGIIRHLLVVDLADPARKGENTVTGYSPDKTG